MLFVVYPKDNVESEHGVFDATGDLGVVATAFHTRQVGHIDRHHGAAVVAASSGRIVGHAMIVRLRLSI